MSDQRPPDPPGWPYTDLHLATPHCPYCGWQPQMMAMPNVHPMAFCTNDDCQVVNFDPTRPAVDLIRDAVEAVETVTEDGTTVWGPPAPG